MTPDVVRLHLEALRQQPACPEVLLELADLAATLTAVAVARPTDGAAIPAATVEKAKLIAEALAVGPLVDADRDLPSQVRESLALFERRIVGRRLESDLTAWLDELTAEPRGAQAAITRLEASIRTVGLKIKVLEQYRDLLDLTQ